MRQRGTAVKPRTGFGVNSSRIKIKSTADERSMLLRKLLRNTETNAPFQPEEGPEAGLVVSPVPNAPRARKTSGPYPNLRSALVAATNGAKQERSGLLKIEAILQVDDLIEVTEIALLSYCQSVFDRKLTKLRLGLRS